MESQNYDSLSVEEREKQVQKNETKKTERFNDWISNMEKKIGVT